MVLTQISETIQDIQLQLDEGGPGAAAEISLILDRYRQEFGFNEANKLIFELNLGSVGIRPYPTYFGDF